MAKDQAKDIVPGDIIHLRMGDLIPADAILIDGQVEVDQSALTGESLPMEAGAEQMVYAGAVIKRAKRPARSPHRREHQIWQDR